MAIPPGLFQRATVTRIVQETADARTFVLEPHEGAELVDQYPGRLSVVRHLDDERGLVDAATLRAFVGPDGDADSYICGPEAFMELVESVLPGPGRVFSERFGGAPLPPDEPT